MQIQSRGGYVEAIAVVSASYNATSALRPLLEECGYTGTRLASDYIVDGETFPLVGFASRPWDFDSACIAAVEARGNPEDAARACRALGAPVVWVQQNDTIEWWVQHGTGPSRLYVKPFDRFALLVREQKQALHPLSVYRAKTLGRLAGDQQLDFVDVGLMPLLRAEAGQKLGTLVEEMTRVTLKNLGESHPSKSTVRQVFTAVFRLLAGKILKDKKVSGFEDLDLGDPSEVLERVCRHYHSEAVPHPLGGRKHALKAASQLVAGFGNVRVVSPEALAYIYEHTLVTKKLRKKLGIHATPPYLVDYIVWQLYDWVREIPVGDRHVLEPACGHAPFLLDAMRMLRLEMQGESEARVHAYLKAHIHGLEVDDFAREIARLSLTLADVPNPDGWDLRGEDMYASDVLRTESKRCHVLLSNPPYEKFDEDDKRRYQREGSPVRHKKWLEMLTRTLPNLPDGAVFGLLVPQTILQGAEAIEIRKLLTSKYELREIARFPGRVFEFAEAETTILLGRRRSAERIEWASRVRLRTVGERGLPKFRDTYAADQELIVPQSRFDANPLLALTVPALDEIWSYLAPYGVLSDVATIGRGIEFKGDEVRSGVPAVVERPDAGHPAGYAGVSKKQPIYSTPPLKGIATSSKLIENPRQGMPIGKPQVLVNRTRTSRNRWRLKAILDPEGRPVKNNFLIVRPRSITIPALYLWALLNSPVANAFLGRDTMKRDNPDSDLARLPIPTADPTQIDAVVSAAARYRELAGQSDSGPVRGKSGRQEAATLFGTRGGTVAAAEEQVRNGLLAMDAAVLRLYRLPLVLERQLLDYFRGHVRPGVGAVFSEYFPVKFESLVPLHKFISAVYQNSTPEGVLVRMRPGESETVLAALRAASDAFDAGD